MTVCSRPEDGLRCRQGIKPPLKHKLRCQYGVLLFTAEQCRWNIQTETSIETPNFPFYYGLDIHCEWTIQAPQGRFVSLNITDVMLAENVTVYRVCVGRPNGMQASNLNPSIPTMWNKFILKNVNMRGQPPHCDENFWKCSFFVQK